MTSSNLIPAFSSFISTSTEHHPLDEFTLFPNLPIEIRLEIWRSSFHSRRVRIDIHYTIVPSDNDSSDSDSDEEDDSDSSTQLQERREEGDLPIALLVNKESRTEALKHYCLLLQTKEDLDTILLRGPIWLNPEIDTVCVPLATMANGWYEFFKWLSYVDSFIPGGLQAVRELEMSEAYWDGDVGSSFEESYGRVEKSLLRFSGLQRLRVTSASLWVHDEFSSWKRRLFCHEKKCFLEAVEAFLVKHKDSFVGGAVPKVFVED
jgi:hypothetical protein